MPIEVVKGDIADQPDLDAVINAANAQLMPGGGVAGAIHKAAGPELAEACREHAPIEPGQAVVTQAFELPNRWIIHVLGPRYHLDEPADELLAQGYRNAIELAEKRDMKSVGSPALSAGAFGYPIDEAARIAVETVRTHLPESMVFRFVLFDDSTKEVFDGLVG